MAEVVEREGTNKMSVHRRIRGGELSARKSGGVWLVRL